MKNVFCILLLFVSQVLFAQKHQQLPDEMKIRQVLLKQQEAWNRGSIEEYMNGYWKSDSLIFIGKSNINHGWKLTLESYKKAYPTKTAMGTLKFEILSVEMLSKTSALMIGKWELKKSGSQNASGHFTLLFKKINSIWQIVLDHTS
ncbi:MAG: YybH family protein [Bacteroidia bacterium]